MAGYSFTPKDNKSQRLRTNTSKKVTGKKENNTTTSNNDTLNKLKKPLFIAVAIIVILLLGPQITGNLTLSAEDRDIAQNPDFPDLSKFDANKQFYLCQNQLNADSGKLSQYQLELESKSTTAEACIQQKNTLSSQYNTCADTLTSTKASFTYCNSSKTTLSNEVELYKNELESTKQEYSDFELNNYALTNNYADSFCCIKRAVNSELDIKYYKIKNNKVICTEDSDDDEFDWESC